MEGSWSYEQKTTINELIVGSDFAKQLSGCLNSESNAETREFLIQGILSSYEKALLSLKWSGHMVQQPQPSPTAVTSGDLESLLSVNGSPWSEDFDEAVEDQYDNRDTYKERKMLPKWIDQVKIYPETWLEEPHDDGYSWRKYGQKDTLGATYPRSYYRCTYRNTQNCWATKQVQRSDEDPTVFEITYRGTHTCSYAGAQNPVPAAAPASPEKQEQQQHQQIKINSHFTNTFQQHSGVSESALSVNGSPWSEDFDKGVKDQYDNRDMSKKRKMLPRWTDQVKINPETGLEGPHDDIDGYSWRKYGQKDILGAMYPRSYYRCTYRNTQNCWATKQVQRSDEDPTVFEITYRGTHTCSYAEAQNPAPASPKTREQALSFLSNKMNEFKLDPGLQSCESFITEESSSIFKARENNEVTDQSKQATMSLSVGGKNLDVNQYPKGKDGLVQTEGTKESIITQIFKENYEETNCEQESDSPAESDDEGNKLVLRHMDKKKKAPKESHWEKEPTPLIECHSLNAALKELLELSLSMVQKKKPSEGLSGIGCVNITAHIVEKILTSEVGTIGIHGRDESAKRDVIECLSNLKTLRSHFDKVILVTLPANCGMTTRKLALAQLQTSLCIEANEDDLSRRTAQLLKSMKFLLVIDNIDMQLDMNKMGIPTPSPENGSKIIILTRLEQVCTDMAVDETINLDDEMSWGLFCENASGIALSTEIKPIAREIVRLCNHCSRAIILMARALKNESEYSEWISARNKLLLEVGLDGKDEDIMSAALEFSFEGLEDEMTINCLKSMAFNNNKEMTKESLIGNWICDGVLNTLCEGNKVLENLIDLKLLEIDVYRDIVKLQDLNRDIFMNFIVHPEESCMYIKRGGLGLVKPPDEEEWEHAKEICLMQNEISKLPENPPCPLLSALFLHRNYKLRAIPSSFFLNMPSLQVLNLSKTRIKSLPESLFQLFNLKKLFLRSCNLLRRLPPEIRYLKHLEVLDLEGTKIVALPEGIRELENLVCLEVSISESENHVKITEENPVIPRKVLFALSQLEELNIDIDSEAEWWDSCIGCIIDEVCSLKNLDSLNFYFPSIEHFSHFNQLWRSMEHPALSCFKFIVGQHANRIMSQIPSVAEFELERWDRCLMYINGVGIHSDILERLSDTEAFLLERNSTVKKLSEFGMTCLQQLKCCVLGECNELRELVDGADIVEEDAMECDPHGAGRIFLGSLEFLCVYYMKNLTRIWKGPLPDRCLSNLKCLTMKTCPKLTCVFTKGFVGNLCNLEELVVDDCPAIVTLVTCKNVPSAETSFFLPKLRSITLHYVPELISICGGLRIAPKLEWLSFYNCEKLKSLSIDEVSSKDLRKIRGELSWWKDLQWSGDCPDSLDDIFVPFDPHEVP